MPHGVKCNFFRQVAIEEGDELIVTVLPEGTPIPEGLALHEFPTNCYKLRAAYPCTIKDFNKKINAFMNNLQTIGKDEYLPIPF